MRGAVYRGHESCRIVMLLDGRLGPDDRIRRRYLVSDALALPLDDSGAHAINACALMLIKKLLARKKHGAV